MDVTKVRFEGFKSLYEVTCDLEHFTVITGPNGAGKSNFVDALHFLGEIYAHGLEFAVSRAGGYDNIAHRRTRRAKRPISVLVEVSLTAAELSRRSRASTRRRPSKRREDPDLRFVLRHEFSFRTSGQSLLADFVVISDRLIIATEDGAAVVTATRGKNSRVELSHSAPDLPESIQYFLDPFGDSRFHDFISERPLPDTALVSDHLYTSDMVYLVRRALSHTRVFQLSPFQCRTTGVPTPNAVLERYGENLPGAADHIMRNDGAAWTKVQDAMRSILPGLMAIEVKFTEDRRLALQFRERGVGRPWNTGEVSDGTIQALAMLIALYDRRTPLLVIEEPENSVHPWILRRFIDLCRDAHGTQIILTTHSPVLLNYVEPETVRLMSLSGGRSQIYRLIDASPDVRDLVTNGELSLFDLYDSGLLRESVPKGLAIEELSDESGGDS